MSDDQIEEAPAKAAGAARRRRLAAPQVPHMPVAQVELLRTLLAETATFLEYGAGGSTYIAGESGVATIVSVESDRVFARTVRRAFAETFPALNLTMLTPNIGPTGMWGRPIDQTGAKGWPGYAIVPWTRLAEMDRQPDLVLIDGRFRAACFLASAMMGRTGSRILFDDYNGREKTYGVAEKYARKTDAVETMAVFEVEELDRDRLKALAVDLALHCVQSA